MNEFNFDKPANDETTARLLKKLDGIFPQGRKAYVHSFGCQQNFSDGEHISGILKSLGYEKAPCEEEADLILFNTCAVRESAETRVLGHIGALKGIKQKNKNMLIIVCGCMTQRDEMRERIKKSYPFVDIVTGTNNLHLLPALILKRLEDGKRVFYSQMGLEVEENMPVVREDKFKVFLPIMQGCDNFCTYCIVPYVKGREMSRKPEDIVNEARELINAGYKEITLLGQNVNSYGKKEGYDFCDLLKQVDAIEGDFFLRFTTSHPKDCSTRLIDTIAESRHMCHHLHLPVQCGSDDILKKMNRVYDIERYMSLINYAKEKMDDISFSSDIIVGFPNETEEDFQKTLDLIKEVRYNNLFSFIYSKRSGTPAAKIDDKVSHKEKTVRMNKLLKIQQKISNDLNNEKIGKTIKVLFDGYDEENKIALGRDSGNIIVSAPSEEDVTGKFGLVTIKEAMSAQIKGEIDKIYN